MDRDSGDIEEMRSAVRKIFNMKVSEFKAFEPITTAEAAVYALGRRACMGEVKAFEEITRLATLTMETEEVKSLIRDPLSIALAELAEQL